MKLYLSSLIKKYYIEFLIFLFFLIVYSLTSSRGIIQGDTGEFLSVAATGGVAHAPGYPLYSLLIFLIYQLSNSPWIVNMSSGFFAAITLVVVFATVKKITKNVPTALVSVLALGTYEVFWFYSQVAQIHVFNVLVESLILYFLVRTLIDKKINYFLITSFLVGVGVATHQTVIFLFPSVLFSLFEIRKKINKQTLIKAFLLSSVGLTSYLYVFWASSTNPPVNWGDVKNIEGLLHLFFRKDYGVVLLSKGESQAPFIYSAFIYYFKHLFSSSWFMIPLFIASTYLLFKKNKIYIAILLSFLLSGPFYYLLMNIPLRSVVYESTIEQYVPYSYIFFAILVGLGAKVIFDYFKIRKTYMLLPLAIFIPVLIFNLQKVRLDNNNLVHDTVLFQLASLPKDAIILTWSDGLFLPSNYFQYVEGYRTDIFIIQVGLMNNLWYRNSMQKDHPLFSSYFRNENFDYKKLCDQFGESGRLYVYPWYSDFNSVMGDKCIIEPVGLMNRIVNKEKAMDMGKAKKVNDLVWNNYFKKINLKNYVNKTSRTEETLYYIAEQRHVLGTYYIKNKKTQWALYELDKSISLSKNEVNAFMSKSYIYFERGEFKKAIEELLKGVDTNSASHELYKNLGLIYGKSGDEENAYKYLKLYLEFNPIDSQLEAIRGFVAQYEQSKKSSSLVPVR